jgi:hypothetical protein
VLDPVSQGVAENYWKRCGSSMPSLGHMSTDPNYDFVFLNWDSEIRQSDLELFGVLAAGSGFNPTIIELLTVAESAKLLRP